MWRFPLRPRQQSFIESFEFRVKKPLNQFDKEIGVDVRKSLNTSNNIYCMVAAGMLLEIFCADFSADFSADLRADFCADFCADFSEPLLSRFPLRAFMVNSTFSISCICTYLTSLSINISYELPALSRRLQGQQHQFAADYGHGRPAERLGRAHRFWFPRALVAALYQARRRSLVARFCRQSVSEVSHETSAIR
jgi:hypothetical protein